MTTRICPERDAACPHGMDCPFADDRYSCKEGWSARTIPAPTPIDELVKALEKAASQETADDLGLWLQAASTIRDLTEENARLKGRKDLWSEDARAAVDALEVRFDISVVGSAHHEGIYNQLVAAEAQRDALVEAAADQAENVTRLYKALHGASTWIAECVGNMKRDGAVMGTLPVGPHPEPMWARTKRVRRAAAEALREAALNTALQPKGKSHEG